MTMATRGVQRGPTPPPPSEVAHLRAPGRARRNRGGESGAEAGDGAPKRRALGWKGSVRGGGLGSTSVLPPAARASIHQLVSLSFLPSPPPGPATVSSASHTLRLSSGAAAEHQPRAAANRRASPRRLRTPPSGAARQVPASKGESAGRAPARGTVGAGLLDRLPASAPRTSWTRRKSRRGDCVRDQQPARRPFGGW